MADTTSNNQRSSIFSKPGEVADFKPKEQPINRPTPEEIDRVNPESKFNRKESADQVTPDIVGKPTEGQRLSKRKPMVYRTGRNATISVKTTPETVERFYRIAEKLGWKVGETFERAVEGLINIHGLD